jgi:hypothetical protein
MSKEETVQLMRHEFGAFLAAHKAAQIDFIDEAKQRLAIIGAWNDDSVLLAIDSGSKALSSALNSVILLERFSAIYHPTTREIEFIYAALPLSTYLSGRMFSFELKGKSHTCRYAESSPELLAIAGSFRPGRKRTESDYRNLVYIEPYVRMQNDAKSLERFGYTKPSSFWVSNIDPNEDELYELARHLNFYMSYYDSGSPNIYLVDRAIDDPGLKPQERYRHKSFPPKIKATPIDDELLHLWHASRRGDEARKFVYGYQILEYASHYALEAEARSRIRKHLSAPHVSNHPDDVIAEILDLLSDVKVQDHLKIDWTLKRAVDPKLVWEEIEKHKDFFSEPTEFDGGVTIDAIVSKNTQADDFAKAWPKSTAVAMRNIRNALSHGREARQVRIIAPTSRNLHKLRRWLMLMSTVTGEAIVYLRDV